MERNIKYFIENSKRQWFAFGGINLEMHYPDRRSCRCKRCIGDFSPDYFFTSDPNLCLSFKTLEHAELMLKQMKTSKKIRVGGWKDGEDYFYVNWDRMEDNIKSVDDCFVTEHEFV